MITHILQDIVSHTSVLDTPHIKVINTDDTTTIEAISKEQDVVLYATVKEKIPGFYGTFGMPNLDVLATHLKCPEYAENARIEIRDKTSDGVTLPGTLHFENEGGNFTNDYQFMSTQLINEALPSMDFVGASWHLEFEPLATSILKLKYQSMATPSARTFRFHAKNGDLMCTFGDGSSHSGEFVFQQITGKSLKYSLHFPVQTVLQILGLVGNKTIQISDAGIMQITIDSGISEYRYLFAVHQK